MKQTLATATLAAAVGIALAMGASQAQQAGTLTQEQRAAFDRAAAETLAQQPGKPLTKEQRTTLERMAKFNLEKCYGVAARGRNDCAEGARSCVGQATFDRDRTAYLLLAKGDCQKIAGGSPQPS